MVLGFTTSGLALFSLQGATEKEGDSDLDHYGPDERSTAPLEIEVEEELCRRPLRYPPQWADGTDAKAHVHLAKIPAIPILTVLDIHDTFVQLRCCLVVFFFGPTGLPLESL